MNPTAGVWRRLGAMFYDTLLVVASLMVVTALFLPLTGGEAITADQVGSGFEYLYRAVLLVVIVLYFGWPWTRSGQTVGMMAWRLRLERNDGSMVRWSDVLKRLAGATVSFVAAGMGGVRGDVDPNLATMAALSYIGLASWIALPILIPSYIVFAILRHKRAHDAKATPPPA